MSNAFDLTVNALREKGLNSDEILEELSKLFQKMSETSNKPDATEEDDDEKTKRLLNRVGVPLHLKGFEYWAEAIICYKETGKLHLGEIYEVVAFICDTTPEKVERAMRYAAEYAFKKCKKEDIEATFGSKSYIDRKNITNREFLSILVNQI